MANLPRPSAARRLLVVIPNWVGDVVLATPILAALRTHLAGARITFLMRRYVAEIVDGGGWNDEAVFWPTTRGLRAQREFLRLAGQLRAAGHDTALLLTNSFRSALLARLARIPRRIGYAREARGWLLTDRLRPLRVVGPKPLLPGLTAAGEFIPTPMVGYYATLAEQIGCKVGDRRLRLGVTPEQEAAGAALKQHYELDGGQRYAIINPGAAFGAAKCWLPERFTEVCDRLHAEHGLRPVLVGAPGEAELLRLIAQRARGPLVCCDRPGTTLGSLKPLIRDAALLVCNDTGPRHYGNAFGVPTVTIFGPTHQAWTDTDYAGEIKLQIAVDCGPCQLRTCPLDHRCMTGLTTDTVIAAVRRLLG